MDIRQLEKSLRLANELKEHDDISLMQWAVVGEVSSGKSTFINALLGVDRLPTGHASTTAMVTRIRPPQGDYSCGTVMLQAYCIDDYLDMMTWLLNEMGEANVKRKDVVTRAKRRIENADDYPEFIAHITSLKQLITLVKQSSENKLAELCIDIDQLSSYLTDTALIWKEAHLYLTTEWSHLPIEWVDTPGFGHHDICHRYIAEHALADVDQSIFMLPPRGASAEYLDVIHRTKKSATASVLVFSCIDDYRDAEGVNQWRKSLVRLFRN